MKRRTLRTHVFNVIYFCEFHNDGEFESQVENYLTDQGINSPESTEIKDKACDIKLHIESIDNEINEVALGWKTSRMSKVDLAILRVALYEIRYDEDVPTSVAINEAVELAKSFSGDESPSFINGILGKLAKKGEA